MESCRFCNSKNVTLEDGLAQCGDCYRSWMYKVSGPFDFEMDDIFGDVDDLFAPVKKPKPTYKKKEIKMPRLDIGASLSTKKKSTDYVGFSDMEDSDDEYTTRKIPVKPKIIQKESSDIISNDNNNDNNNNEIITNTKEASPQNEYYVLTNAPSEEEDDGLLDLVFSEEEDTTQKPIIESNQGQKKEQKEKISKPTNRYNPFILFNKDMRAKLKEKNPELDNHELSKLVGNEWKNISPAKKEAYTILSERKKESYKNKPIHFAKRPKPPPNVWIIYCKEQVPKIRAKFPHMNINDASKIAGQNWKALSIEDKEVYRAIAQKAKEEFKEKYPEDALAFFEKSEKKRKKLKKKSTKKK